MASPARASVVFTIPMIGLSLRRMARRTHGLWRGMEGKIVSEGSRTWQRGQLRLPMARFSRECNGGDLRIDVPAELPIHALWLEAANAKAEPSRPGAEIELATGPGQAGKIRQAKPGERFTLVSGDVAVEVGIDGLFSVARRSGTIGLMKATRAVLPFQFKVKKGRDQVGCGCRHHARAPTCGV